MQLTDLQNSLLDEWKVKYKKESDPEKKQSLLVLAMDLKRQFLHVNKMTSVEVDEWIQGVL